MPDLPKGWDAPVIAAAADAEGRILWTSHAHCAATLAASLESLRALPDWSAGDVGITNDVYHGSSHPTEISAATPLMAGSGIIGWTLLRTDVPDIGGWELGSYTPRALDIWSEGGRIVPAKAFLKGQPRREVLELLELNSRTPRLNRTIVTALCRAAIARPKPAALPAKEEIPSIAGSREGSASLRSPDAEPLTLKVQIRQAGARLKVSFPDLPAPAQSPLNATRAITLDAIASGIAAALRIDGTGLHRLIDLELADDTLLSAARRKPAGWARAMTGAALFQAVGDALGAHNAPPPERDPHLDRATGRLDPARAQFVQTLERGLQEWN